ncbi:PhnA domain-containing protein [Marinicellulosiphila megalodicopiae]|uniref:PhnA domain-containing protein n=1 Tax=Marinicellulosiphila megalodicopiae TaxID=2724896 RepID=UPI003BAF4030
MSYELQVLKRAQNTCELCKSTTKVSSYLVSGKLEDTPYAICVCDTCLNQIESGEFDEHHWRCLGDSMWHPEIAVQVLSYRVLSLLKKHDWANDLLEMMYLDDDNIEWAKSGLPEEDNREPTRDSNGTQLFAGDNVTVIKDLKVKGSSMVAKQGTAVRGISLTDNPEHIEGRVDGTRIVLLSCYLKKM